MARNRVIYQSEALYTSKALTSTGVSEHVQLERVQSANYNFSISRQDINQYGHLSRLDSIVLDPPTVALDFSYYLTDGYNERALGFYVQTGGAAAGNFPSGHMVASDGRNFYITTVAEGSDATGTTGVDSVIGIGNAYLSDYTLDLAVGSLPTVSVTMEAANILANTGIGYYTGAGITGLSGIQLPAVKTTDGASYSGTGAFLPIADSGDSSISALRPGDVTISIQSLQDSTIADISGTTDADAIHIQSASLSIPLSRSPLQRLGTRFPFARTVDFPVTATLSVNAIVNEVTARNLATVINSETEQDVTLTLKDTNGTGRMTYTLKGCTLDSESFSSSIGSNKTVDLTITTQIGGPNDTAHGILVSGANQVAI